MATTAPAEAGLVTSTVTSKPSSLASDPNPDNNAVKTTVDVQHAADFQVSAAATAKAVAGKDWVSYDVTLLSLGPAKEAKGVKLTGTLPAFAKTELVPAGTRAVHADDCTITGRALSCELDTVKHSEPTKVISLRGLVAPNTTGTLKATFQATSANPANDPSEASDTVSTAVTADADLAVTGTAGKISKGKLASYAFTVVNNGPSDAAQVILTGTLGTWLSARSVKGTGCKKSGNGIACSWPVIKAGQKVTINLVADVHKNAKGQTGSTATVKSTTPDPRPTNNTAKVTGTITG